MSSKMLSTSLFFGLLTLSSAAQAKTPTFDGTYLFAGSTKQKAAHQAAIKKVASKAPFFFRGRVNKTLQKAFAIRPRLMIQSTQEEMAVHTPKKKPIMTSLDGSPKIVRRKKRTMILTRKLEGRVLKETIQPKGKKGFRKHHYTFSKDGKTMTLHTIAYLAKLKQTLRFTLTYKKQ